MTRLYVFILALVAAFPLYVFAQNTQQPAPTQQQPTEFVPLTSLPGIDTIKGSPNLPDFLNNIYMIAIGVAAALAVFQIIRAGVYFMLNKGSISEAEQARHLLQMSVLGLLLVLSPVIVFGIINPKILELNFAVDALKTADPVVSTDISSRTLWTSNEMNRTDAKAKCEADGGTAQFVCTPPGGVARTVPITEACKEGESAATQCISKEGAAFDTSCKDYTVAGVSPKISSTGLCDKDNGYKQIAPSCCAGMSTGVCCGKTQAQIVAEKNAVVASQVVDNMIKACPDVKPTATQTQCLVTQLTPTVDSFNKCVVQAAISGSSIDPCLSSLMGIVPGKVTGCMPISNEQGVCLYAAAGNYVRTAVSGS